MTHQLACESPYECESWLRIFRRFDTNHDGYIATHDLKRFIRESAYSLGLRPEEATKLLMDVDANKDHVVDFAEFCTLMSRAKSMHMRNVMFFAAKMVVPKGVRTQPFSYLQQYTCFPPPLFMLFISIIEIAIYVYYLLTWPKPYNILIEPVSRNWTLIFTPEKRYEAWRYLTYMFVHAGITHIVFNVLTQIILGIPLELVHKQWRVCVVYLSGVLSGSLLHYVIEPTLALVGASAGVYALLAAHLSELLVNWTEMEFACIRALFLVVVVGIDFGSSIYTSVTQPKSARKVSFEAHLAGFIAGALMGIIVLRNFRKKPWERVMWWIAVTLVSFLLATLIVLNFAPKLFTS